MELVVGKQFIANYGQDTGVLNAFNYIWEYYKSKGFNRWYTLDSVLTNGIELLEPTTILLLNELLDPKLCNVLRDLGYTIIYIGNGLHDAVTFADTKNYDVFILASGIHLANLIMSFYTVSVLADQGDANARIHITQISDNVKFVYGNKVMDLCTLPLNGGTYISGINGPYICNFYGGTVNNISNECLTSLFNSKGIISWLNM